MSFHDFLANFVSISIIRVFDKYKSVSIEGEWNQENSGGCLNNRDTYGNNPQFFLKVKKPTECIFYM